MKLQGLLIVFCVCSSLCIGANSVEAAPSTDLLVSGDVASSKTYTAKDLRQFPSKEITVYFPDGVRKYTGALMRDIVAASIPLEPDKFALRQSFIVATGTDGYFTMFTWGELFLSSPGVDIFVIYKRDGAALADDEGSFATIALWDSKPGLRYVKWLKSIELRRFHR